MNKVISTAMALACLAACAAVEEITPAPAQPATEALNVGAVTAATFNNSTEELRVQIAFAGEDALQAFNRNGEVLGYLRFEQQADGLTPAYTAFARESGDGSVWAIVAAEGGQFGRFSGGTFARQITYAAPTSGLARYHGGYVGLLNTGQPAGGAPGDAGEATPRVSSVVTGNALMNADFNNMEVRGRINNRQAVIGSTTLDLPEIILIGVGNNINASGSFKGTVEQRGPQGGPPSGVGTYSGTFGGNQAAAVAGMVALDGDFIDLTGVDNEFEYGIFVLDRCQAATAGCGLVVNP